LQDARERRSQVSAFRAWDFAYFQRDAQFDIYQETFMKRIATALVLGSLIVATQAASADAFPAGSTEYWSSHMPAASSSYADTHPGKTVESTGPAYPTGTDDKYWVLLPASSSYADAHAGDPAVSAKSVFPAGSESEEHFNLDDPL
jgi:hypothetical protein